MSEYSRRDLLAGSLLLTSMGAGCQAFDGEKPPQEGTERSEPTIGTSPSGRPIISNGDRTIYVDPNGGDDSANGTRDEPLATIQEAVQRVPIYLRHQYVIDLATVPETPVTYDEDVLVPAVVGTGQAALEKEAVEPGPFLNLILRGRENEPEAVEVGSVTFGNVVGTSAANLFFVTVGRDSPYDNEKCSVTAYGTGEVHLYGVRFTDGPSNGVLAYGAKMKASVVDFGDRNLNFGVRGKRHASIIADRHYGETRNSAYLASSNSRIGIKEGSILSGNPTYDTDVGGLIHDFNTDTWYGVGDSGGGMPSVSDHPADARPGDVWYVDGSGDAEEGFYGLTNAGVVRFD